MFHRLHGSLLVGTSDGKTSSFGYIMDSISPSLRSASTSSTAGAGVGLGGGTLGDGFFPGTVLGANREMDFRIAAETGLERSDILTNFLEDQEGNNRSNHACSGVRRR